jgi:hypothetical protein
MRIHFGHISVDVIVDCRRRFNNSHRLCAHWFLRNHALSFVPTGRPTDWSCLDIGRIEHVRFAARAASMGKNMLSDVCFCAAAVTILEQLQEG